jgi:hypothetical protein
MHTKKKVPNLYPQKKKKRIYVPNLTKKKNKKIYVPNDEYICINSLLKKDMHASCLGQKEEEEVVHASRNIFHSQRI